MPKSPRFNSCRFFAIVLSVATLLVGCGDDSPSGPALSATPPAGWTVKENYPMGPGVSADYIFLAPTNAGYSANVFLLTSPASGQSPASAISEAITQVQSEPSISNFSVDSNSAVLVGGRGGYRAQFRYQQIANGIVFSILQRQLLVVHDNKDCQLVLTRLQSDSIDGAAAFRAIEASLKLN